MMIVLSSCIGAALPLLPVQENIERQSDIIISFHEGNELSFQVSFYPSEVNIDTINLGSSSFVSVELCDEGYTTNIGEAKLPMIRRFLEIPEGTLPQMIINTIVWETQVVTGVVVPVQPSISKDDGVFSEVIMDDVFYSLNCFSPDQVAEITVIGEIRGRRIALLEIAPVQYNPVTNEIRILKECVLEVALPGSNMYATNQKIDRYSSASFDLFFDTLLVNNALFKTTNNPKNSAEGFLIIVYDAFFDEITPLVNVKVGKGYDTTVIKTSEIPGGPTKENIKTYIQTAYDTWSPPPAFILLVGDTPQIPTYTGTTGPDAADLYFVTVAGADYFPDIFIGRFPAADEAQVTAMVDKTVYYETGNFPTNDWIKKAAFLAGNDNYQISEGTHNYVISMYLEPNGYTCDKLYEVTYGATTQDVTDSINDGRSLVIMSGHGSQTSWGDGPSYSQSNVQSLSNDGFYPFVCSHSCLTGSFQIGECFGETWLRVAHKGGLAFWGASESTYWDEDDILEKKMFSAWWDDGLTRLGGMTDMAKYYLYQQYGGGGLSKYYYEAYNILGDPSVVLWSDDPNQPPTVPEPPVGPMEGLTFIEYTFSATASSDPEGEQVFLRFNFDDGIITNWVGPFNAGESTSESHIWYSSGEYAVRVQAKDESGRETTWSEPLMVTIGDKAKLEILSLEGGVGAAAVARNTMNDTLSNVHWSLTLKNGLIFIAKQMGGKIEELGAEQQITVRSGLIFGFGPVEIRFVVGDASKTGSGFMLGLFLINVH